MAWLTLDVNSTVRRRLEEERPPAALTLAGLELPQHTRSHPFRPMKGVDSRRATRLIGIIMTPYFTTFRSFGVHNIA
jgi:hypothetical protein